MSNILITDYIEKFFEKNTYHLIIQPTIHISVMRKTNIFKRKI